MFNSCESIDFYLPHRFPMQLIDRVREANEISVTCEVLITPEHIFYDPMINGVHAWIGIELMAQTAAVFAALKKPRQNPAIGFLMSVRKFSSTLSHFKCDDELMIIAENEYLADHIGVFQCGIMLNHQRVASAKLNAVQP